MPGLERIEVRQKAMNGRTQMHEKIAREQLTTLADNPAPLTSRPALKMNAQLKHRWRVMGHRWDASTGYSSTHESKKINMTQSRGQGISRIPFQVHIPS
jgi:hypothetical protein